MGVSGMLEVHQGVCGEVRHGVHEGFIGVF